ncbi:ATPase, V1/A1 complex, subunit E [Umbelopsis sp. AD052]|nr:ATPase, V1/A1 complex, subunit E [Umbelopsis sp. AD052]
MAAVRALNDDEVFNEMKKMVSFIKQEALEKAREIKVKADEEFNIEKAKIVRQESLNIEATFERKIKQAEVQKRIAQSNQINKSRLRVLQARQQMLDELFDEARSKLTSVSKDSSQYPALLQDLVLQGFYSLMETNVKIQCRKEDVSLVEKAIAEAVTAYEESMGDKINATIDEENIPSSNAGGVILSGLNGKIKVNNTLEARLNILEDGMLPQIRVLLFGHSPSRKFFN